MIKSEVGYILEVDVKYPKKIYELHGDISLLPGRKKVGKLVTNLQDKNEYVVHIKSLRQALNYRIILKKVHGAISFNQDKWLKPCTEMNSRKIFSN